MLVMNIGRRGMGKTTLAVHMADKVGRRVMLDPRCSIRRPGAVVVRTAATFADMIDGLADRQYDELIYSPIETDLPDAFSAFAEQLRAWTIDHPKLPIAALVDEASFYGDVSANPAFMYALKCSDPRRMNVILTCHRPSDIPVDVRAIANRWCMFRTTQEHDLEVIRRRCKAEVVDVVQTLEDRQFVAWNDDDGTYTVHRHPFTWATDLMPRGAKRSIVELH